jgi:hypothetical protein
MSGKVGGESNFIGSSARPHQCQNIFSERGVVLASYLPLSTSRPRGKRASEFFLAHLGTVHYLNWTLTE